MVRTSRLGAAVQSSFLTITVLRMNIVCHYPLFTWMVVLLFGFVSCVLAILSIARGNLSMLYRFTLENDPTMILWRHCLN
jgi:hypothetical protein